MKTITIEQKILVGMERFLAKNKKIYPNLLKSGLKKEARFFASMQKLFEVRRKELNILDNEMQKIKYDIEKYGPNSKQVQNALMKQAVKFQ